ncbi:MAG: hypothetical protein SNF33_05985 [Candidatus Algichlamydia australiensis]|nr:hypothetical protein [Chlamydiales bacterium]
MFSTGATNIRKTQVSNNAQMTRLNELVSRIRKLPLLGENAGIFAEINTRAKGLENRVNGRDDQPALTPTLIEDAITDAEALIDSLNPKVDLLFNSLTAVVERGKNPLKIFTPKKIKKAERNSATQIALMKEVAKLLPKGENERTTKEQQIQKMATQVIDNLASQAKGS